MAIFAVLHSSDKKVQVGDKLRLNAGHSFTSVGEILKYEIKPEEDEEFMEVPAENPYLDWVYETAGHVQADVRITVGEVTAIGHTEFDVLTEEEDCLFSDDNDLKSNEPGILSFLPPGKSSFLYAHREAQSQIMSELNKLAGEKRSGRLVPQNLGDKQDVAEWSKFLTLSLIFQSMVNAPDDAMSAKADNYSRLADLKKNITTLALDLNKDGSVSDSEKHANLGSVPVVRR